MRNGQTFGGGVKFHADRRIYLFYNTCLAPKNSCENAAKEPRKLKKVINLGSDQDLSWGEFVVTSKK